jgi:cobalt-zinc-cadmium efflux system membrane fusion protein
MKSIIKLLQLLVLTTSLALFAGGCANDTDEHAAQSGSDDHGEEHDDDNDHEGEGDVLHLDEIDRQSSGVKIERVSRRALGETITLPGEVVPNAYRSTQVSPRVAAQVVKRHAHLGDTVKTGQALVTLSSVEMAEAQGQMLVASREWQRVKDLGREVVSDRRYTEAEVTQEQALSRVLAFGMSKSQAKTLLKSGDPTKSTGEFQLISPQAGTVVSDEFIVGELIQPGYAIFEITDESLPWVEARVPFTDVAEISIGQTARVRLKNGNSMDGTVTQVNHRGDEITRTQTVRIEVPNPDDTLHSGQFVDVSVLLDVADSAIAVPMDAVTIIRGKNSVFIKEGGELHLQEVVTGRQADGWIEIREGLATGDEIATAGVFYLKSLILKSEMGEGHAH